MTALLRNPTVAAALIIAAGLVLMAFIMRGGLKRLGRGLSEGARALNGFTASLDQQNRIAADVDALHAEQERHRTVLTRVDGAIREWYQMFQWLPTIRFVDRYLTAMDGTRYTQWQDDPIPQPAERDGGTGDLAAQPGPQYPELPFDPHDPSSIEAYLLRLVHEVAPADTTLEDPLPQEFAQDIGTFRRRGDNWRRWAIVKTNARFGPLLEQYGLPVLGSDMTQTFPRVDEPRPGD